MEAGGGGGGGEGRREKEGDWREMSLKGSTRVTGGHFSASGVLEEAMPPGGIPTTPILREGLPHSQPHLQPVRHMPTAQGLQCPDQVSLAADFFFLKGKYKKTQTNYKHKTKHIHHHQSLTQIQLSKHLPVGSLSLGLTLC